MSHDSKFLWLAQENIMNFVKKQYPRVKKVNHVRYTGAKIFFYSIIFNILSIDGVANHFKNNYTLMNLLYHYKDFYLEATWTFSATGRGKGSCEGNGAAVKAIATSATLQSHTNTSFQIAFDFWSSTFDKNHRSQLDKSCPIECCFLPKKSELKKYVEKYSKKDGTGSRPAVSTCKIISYGSNRIFFQKDYQVSGNITISILNRMKQYLVGQYRCQRIISIAVINNNLSFMVISNLYYLTFTSIFWACFDVVSHL